MALAYCKAAGLHIMQKPAHIVPMRVMNKQTGQREWQDTIMPGINAYRAVAHRTNTYAGMGEIEYGEKITQKLGDIEITFPE